MSEAALAVDDAAASIPQMAALALKNAADTRREHRRPDAKTSPGATPADLARRWLGAYCEREAGVRAALLLLGDQQRLDEAARWPAAPTASAALVSAARAAVKRGCAVALIPPVGASDGPGRILSAPLCGARGAFGALAVAVQVTPADSDEALLHGLTGAAASLAAMLQESNAPARREAGEHLHYLQASLLGPQPLAQAASALASALAATLDFERVSLGLTRPAGFSVIALSHGAEFAPRQGLILALAAAMQEAIDQGQSVVYPQPVESAPQIVQAHAALSAQGMDSVLSIPLIDAGQAIGALCFERRAAIAASTARAIEQLVCRLAPLIELKRRAEQPWQARLGAALRAGWRAPGRYSPRLRRLGWLTALGAALLLACVPLSHRIGAPARLEGAVQRVLAAPADGYLHAAHARAGDAVTAGQLLAELEPQDLLLLSRKWQAELSQHENSAAAALARADRAQYALAQARAGEAAAQLELVRGDLARARIAAPIDGIVLKGDLAQALGAPVKRGDVLFTLAPRDALRLTIEVDEREIGEVVPGQRGQLVLSALPGERLAFAIERVMPMAVSHDGRNVFEVEASLDQRPAGLRPGLQGIAKIDAGTRPLGWIVTHRLGEWLQMALWSWGL